MPTTGQLLRKARIQAKMSQAKLGRRLGVSNTLVAHWEADRKPVLQLEAVASELGLSAQALQGDAPAEARGATLYRQDNPPPVDLPPAEEGGTDDYLNMTETIRWILDTYGLVITTGQFYKHIAENKLPAYTNKLRLNQKKEPTLLFRPSELRPWLQTMIRPLVH
jgi:transcriptional regulator with XRE-family HTH domain